MKSIHKMLEVLLKDNAYRKESFHSQESVSKLVQNTYKSLAIIKPKKHQLLADSLLHSFVVTRNDRVCCAIKSTPKSIWQNPQYLKRDLEPEAIALKWP